ncbi:MAG: DUF4381 family protein [Pseudomonadota bacterium]
MQGQALPLMDIHAAPAPPWWPPAWGWWVLAALAAVLLVFFAYMLWRRWQQRRRVRELAAELTVIDERWQRDGGDAEAAAAISVYLRRLFAHVGENPAAAAVTGQAWVDLLSSPQDLDPKLKQAAGQLTEAPYRRQASADVESLLLLSRFWLARLVSGVRG